MKKYLALVSLAAFITTASASESYTEEKTYNGWTVFLSSFTVNDALPNKLDDLSLAYKAGVQYSIDSNWYTSIKTAYNPDSNIWLYGGTVGFQGNTGQFFQPYLELSLNINQNKNRNYLMTVDYDIGTNFIISDIVIPYVSVNDFFAQGRESASAGVNIALNTRLTLGVEYDRNIENKGEGATMKLSYSF